MTSARSVEQLPLMLPSLPGGFSWTQVAEALTVLLERRYLEGFDPALFRLLLDDEDGVPLLCKVRAVAHQGGPPTTRQAVPQLLAACHLPGHDLVTVLHGHGDGHALYYGQRRRAGYGSADSAIAGLRGAFRAELPGVSLGDALPLLPTGWKDLASFLASAPAFASLTGVPAPGGRQLDRSQLGRLVSAMGSRRYALMVVAEALPQWAVEEGMAVCRRIVSELHPAITSMVTEGRSATETHSVMRNTTIGGDLSLIRHVAPALAQAVGFALGAGGLVSLIGAAGQWAHPLGVSTVGTTLTDMQAVATSDSTMSNRLDAEVRHCSKIVEAHHDRLGSARGGGWWRSALYLCAEDESALHCAAQALRGASAGDGADVLEPMRLQRLPVHVVRPAMQMGRLIELRARDGGIDHPMGAVHQAIATCVSCQELAVLVAPPQEEAPGLAIDKGVAFALAAPTPDGPCARIGTIAGTIKGSTAAAVAVSARALNEHVLVVGTPGSGKTNTCMALLLQAHGQLRVPFLVIEPAKTEYRRLAGEPSLRGKLRVYSIGGDAGLPLRLNPLRPVPGASLLGHIDLLKAVFNASFSMGPGMPQVLEQALVEVYERFGWNLYTGSNEALSGLRVPVESVESLLPTLGDLQKQIEIVLSSRNYSDNVRRDLGAALFSRINSLRLGAKGLVLDTRRSTPLSELFEAPVVLELNALRDDEEKSFVMAVVLALLHQHCEVRQRQFPHTPSATLQHLTLVEEAHRLLSAPLNRGLETANPRGKGVSMFTDMLAELRALGEGFIVAEQIPTKLASDVLKNTNLKIIHRVTAPTDCEAVGQSVNLTPEQMRKLVSLPSGHAVVHGLSARFGDPVADATLVVIDSVKESLHAVDELPGPVLPVGARWIWRLGGCESCVSPCVYYPTIARSVDSASGEREFRSLSECALIGSFEGVSAAFFAWHSAVSKSRTWSGGDLHCLFVHAAQRWLWKVLSARNPSGPAGASPADLLRADALTVLFGRLVVALSARRPDASDLVRELHAALVDAVAAEEANAGLAACAACPAPCRGLAFVAARAETEVSRSLASHLPRSLTDPFDRVGDADSRMAKLVEALDRSLDGEPHALPLPERKAARYCQLAHVKVRADQEESKTIALSLLIKWSK